VPETLTVTTTALTTGSGDTFTATLTASGSAIERASPSVPAAKTGSLTTRTDADTGVCTMDPGHGFATSDKLDVFWSGGRRRNMTATVATNAVTVDGGSGDNLPVVNTAVTVAKPTEVAFVVAGNAVTGIAVSSPRAGFVVFCDNANTPADIAAATFTIATAGTAQVWATGNGVTNPLANTTTSKVKFSHGDSSAQTMKAAVVYG
jgi:hypothetical protein